LFLHCPSLEAPWLGGIGGDGKKLDHQTPDWKSNNGIEYLKTEVRPTKPYSACLNFCPRLKALRGTRPTGTSRLRVRAGNGPLS